ncbi:unnamed protein product, partial [Rotaria sordida]
NFLCCAIPYICKCVLINSTGKHINACVQSAVPPVIANAK